MFYIKRNNKRYNSKTFPTYEEARKYVRRKITALYGSYRDAISGTGFAIVAK